MSAAHVRRDRARTAVCATWAVPCLALGLLGLALAATVRAEVPPAGDTRIATGNADAAQVEHLSQARELFKASEWRRAIDEHLDPVIGHFESAHKDSADVMYSAQNMVQALMYSALPREAGRGATVLDATWADAYELKGYALTELGDLDGARAALQSALQLSPMSATYANELAFTYVRQKSFPKAVELYRQAASYAEIASDESQRNDDLARAWRGEAYVLIEQGELAEAKKLLKRCLRLDRNDERARAELEYIKRLEQQRR